MTIPAEGSSSSYAAFQLQEGERLLRDATIHYGIYWKGFAILGLAIFLLLTVFNLGVFILLCSGISLGVAWLTKHYLMLALTDRRVLIRYGIINLETIQMHFDRVESAELARTIMGRILGYSTVLITGTGSRIIAIPFVKDGEEFRADLDNMIFKRTAAKGA